MRIYVQLSAVCYIAVYFILYLQILQMQPEQYVLNLQLAGIQNNSLTTQKADKKLFENYVGQTSTIESSLSWSLSLL